MEEVEVLKALLDRYDQRIIDHTEVSHNAQHLRRQIQRLEHEKNGLINERFRARQVWNRWEPVIQLCEALHRGEMPNNADFAEEMHKRIAVAVEADANDIPF